MRFTPRCWALSVLALGCGDHATANGTAAPADATARRIVGTSGADTSPLATATDSMPAPEDASSDAGDAAATTTTNSCAGTLICDDFESYALNAAPSGPWTSVANANGTVRINTTRARSGTKSVRVATNGQASFQSAYFRAQGAPLFPLPANTMFGRMMLWTANAPRQGVHWSMIGAEGPVPGKSFRGRYSYGGQPSDYGPGSVFDFLANYYASDASADCWQHSRSKLPSAKWTCVEWQFEGPQNAMRMWMDGAAVSDMTVVQQGEGCLGNGTGGKWLAPTFDTLLLGWESYQTDDPREMWIDDVAIGTSRIGCPPP